MNLHTAPKDPAELNLAMTAETVDRILHLVHGARLIGERIEETEAGAIDAILDTVAADLDDVLKALRRGGAPAEDSADAPVGTYLADLIEARKPTAAAYVEASERFQELKSDCSGSALARWQANHDHEVLQQRLVQAEQAICDYRPTSMTEVAMKAKFALAEGIADTDDLIDRFLMSLR